MSAFRRPRRHSRRRQIASSSAKATVLTPFALQKAHGGASQLSQSRGIEFLRLARAGHQDARALKPGDAVQQRELQKFAGDLAGFIGGSQTVFSSSGAARAFRVETESARLSSRAEVPAEPASVPFCDPS